MIPDVSVSYKYHGDGAARICFAIDPEQNGLLFDALFDWLLKNWGDPKNNCKDFFINAPENMSDVYKELEGIYGICIIAGGKENYATLWSYDRLVDGIEYIGNGGSIYFWQLEANYNTLEESLEKKLTKITPHSDMNQVAIEGLDIMTKMSADRMCELSATIYDKDGDGLYRIAGLSVGNNEYVVPNDDRLKKLGVTTRMYKAVIHTHVEGTVTFSGADFGSACLREIPIYMKHIKYTTVLKATALIVDQSNLDLGFYRHLRKHGSRLFYVDGQPGIDSCDDLKHSGISRTHCPINNRTVLSQPCSYLKELATRQPAIQQLLNTATWTNDVAHCLYGIFKRFGQEVTTIRQ